MIQRAQTIYLLLAFICMVLLIFFPIFSIEVSTTSGDITLEAVFGKDGVVGERFEGGRLPLYFVYISLALLTAATILMYKKRPRQLLLCRLNFILHLMLVSGIYIFYYFGKAFIKDELSSIESDVEVVFYMQVGFFLLIPTVAFLWLAIRGIRRDENLVKSLDRLR